MIKIKLEDLKKAVAWIEANGRSLDVKLDILDCRNLLIECFDNSDRSVAITIYDSEISMKPRIQKTEVL